MEEKNVEKVDSMTKYENETFESQNAYDEFDTKTAEQSERKHEISFFGEFVPELQTFSLANWWSRASPILRVVAGFICIFITDGVMFSFPHSNTLSQELIKKVPYLQIVRKVQLCVYSLCGPLAANLCHRFGCRSVCIGGTLLATFGFLLAGHIVDASGVVGGLGCLVGVGMVFIFVSTIISMTDNDSKNRFFALGLSLSGIVVARVTFPSMVTSLMVESGWRVGYQALGGITCLCLVSSLVMEPGVTGEHGERRGFLEERRVWLERMVGKRLARSRKLREFIVFSVGHGITASAATIILVHKPRLEEHLVLEMQEKLFITGKVLGGMMGLVVGGASQDRGWFNPLPATRIIVMCAALASFLHSNSETVTTTFILSTNMGFFTGIITGLFVPLILTLVGSELLPPGVGFSTAVSGFCQIVIYIIVEQTNVFFSDPFQGFHTSGILFLLAGLVYTLAIWLDKKKEREQDMEMEPLYARNTGYQGV